MQSSAHAATGTWTGAAGATWDTTTANWSNLTGTPWDLTNGGTNAAVFNTAGATSTVSGTVYTNAITFANTATISGGSISLAGTTPTITTSSNGIISSILTGASGLTKAGAGTLTLSGSNTYSGTTNITAGVVNIQNASALGGTAQGTTVAAGAQLQLQGGITVTGESLSINASNVNALLNNSGSNTWAGAITADGVASFSSTGDLSAYNRIESGNGSLLTLSGPITIAAPAASGTASGLLVLGAGNMVISGAISGGKAGNISFVSSSNGPGTRTLSGSNSYLGWTSVNGNLTLEGGNAIPDTSRVVSNAASMRLVLNASETIGGLAASNAGAQINLNANTLTIGADNTTPGAGDFGGASYQGTIIGSGGITKIGTATLTLAGANTYSGTTAINNGTLALTGAGAIASTGAVNVAASGTFDISGITATSLIIGSLAGSAGSVVTLGAKLLTVGDSTSPTFAGAIGGSGGLTKTGAGTLVLSGSSTYTGTTSINAGTLQIGSAGSINSTSGITVNGSGAELKYNSATALSKPLTLTQGTVSGTGTINTPVAIGANVTLSPGNSPGTQTYQSGTFASGGTYAWEVNNWTSGTAGVNFDQAIFTNGLAITSSSASRFTINLVSLQADNSTGAVPGFNSGLTGLSFTIASGTMTGYSPSVFTLGTSSFLSANTVSGSANGGFWLSTTSGSDQLILNYAPSARYTLSATPAATAIRTGGSTVITGAIANSTADRTGADSMAFAGLSVGTGALSTTNGTLLSGNSASGTVTYTGTAAGQFAFTPSVSSATNVNLASAALAGMVTSGTVTVYSPAVATIASTTISLGNVYASGTFGTQNLSITNSGAAASAFQEGLSGQYSTTSGQATGSGSFTSLYTGSASSAISVGLGGSVNTGSVGVKSGTVTLGFTSTGTTSAGSTGLGTLALAAQNVVVSGTVWNAAGVNAITMPISLGNVRVGGTFGSSSLTITNTAASGQYTEVLGVTGSTTGLATLTGSVVALAGGSSSTGISVGLSGSNTTSSAGIKSGTATLAFTSTGGPGTASISNQAVAVTGTVWNAAVATTSGSVNLGTVIVGASSLSQALSITNSAPTDGFSEKLNASFGTLSGVTTNSGSIALLAANATDSSAMIVALATGSVGTLAGSAQLTFATDGQGTSGLAAAALSPQTVNVYGTVLDHATPGFLGVLNPLTTSTLALNFGSVDETAGLQSLTFSLTNLSALAGADLTAGLALTGTGTELGSGFSLSGAAFSNLLAGGTSGLFTVGFTPSGQGSFSQIFKLSFSDNQSLSGAAARRDLFVAANIIVVPEPGALALAGIGIAAAAWAARNRRRSA